MHGEEQSLFLLVPAEIRLHIYSFLLDDGGNKWLWIRNKPPLKNEQQASSTCFQADSDRSSTKYNVMEQTSMFHRRCYKTTYHLANSHVDMHTSILAVCRLLYTEAADLLYGKHCFDFGHHIEAVVPFLADRTPHTRAMVTHISVYKRGPLPCLGCSGDKYEWAYMCRYLSNTDAVKRLKIVMECGRPAHPWEGVQELSKSDIRLLSLIGHDTLEWVRDLSQVKNLDAVDIIPDVRYLPVPKSPSMVVYAALSASIEQGLVEFLRSEMIASA